MKKSLELEASRKELLNPKVTIIESIMNFEPGQRVGINPTYSGYANTFNLIRGIQKRGTVKSVKEKEKLIRIKWDSFRWENIHYSFLKIYS